MTRFLLRTWIQVIGAVFASTLLAAEPQNVDGDSYQLYVRDLIKFAVLDEPETVVEQRIDGQGRIRVPYLGNVNVAGMSIREAEEAIEKAYIENHIYTSLQVTINVVEYATKEVSVLGQVNNPGRIKFPIEENSISIVDVVAQAGGFTGIARSREVRVTRNAPGENGERVFTVNVDQMLTGGRGGNGDGEETFHVLPGDVIHVPERFF